MNERSRDGRRRATRPRPSSSQPNSQNIGPVAYYARKLLYPTTDRLSLVVQPVSKIATPPVTVRAQRARTPHEHQVRDGAHRVHVRDASRRAELRQGANLDAPVRARPSPSSRARRGNLRVEGFRRIIIARRTGRRGDAPERARRAPRSSTRRARPRATTFPRRPCRRNPRARPRALATPPSPARSEDAAGLVAKGKGARRTTQILSIKSILPAPSPR